MTQHVINSAESLSRFIGDVREEWNTAKYLRVTVKTGKARSLKQNSFSHTWYEQLANELREDDALGWKCYCKLHHGVPILRAEDADFREAYDSVIRPLAYEQKLQAMKFWPVTSLMTKAQLSKYAKSVREDFRSDVRADKVLLEFPEPQKVAA